MEDEIIVALYHDEDSEIAKECGLRRLIDKLMDTDDDPPTLNQILPIPHTTDFLSVLQNNTEITFTFKYWGSLTGGEVRLLEEAHTNLGALYMVEAAFHQSLAERVPAFEDQNIPMEQIPGAMEWLRQFRDQVRDLLDQEIERFKKGGF
jgi:hypothetical protein